MRAPRPALLLAFLAACGREPEPPRPTPPTVPAALPAPRAPLNLIAFIRGGDLWTLRADSTGERRLTFSHGASAADPAWSPARDALAFTAASEPPFALHPRAVFTVRIDGTDLRQVTPLPRADRVPDDVPRSEVRGRAVRQLRDGRRELEGMTVTAYGMNVPGRTAHDGSFTALVPVGGGWVKIAGTVDGRLHTAVRLASGPELKDVVLRPGGDDVPAAPAWAPDGSRLHYLLRHSLVDRDPETPLVTLRRIRRDGAEDETLLALSRFAVVAGPVARGDRLWIKSSAGRVLVLDAATRRTLESVETGVSTPDALAVTADGRTAATLAMDPVASTRSIILVSGTTAESFLTFPKGEPPPESLDFSPDGGALVVTRGGDLWILDRATRGMRLLVKDGAQPTWHGR